MEGVIGVQAIIQLTLMVMLFIPLIYWYRLNKNNSELEDLIDVNYSKSYVSIILPMRNEAVNVKRKLLTIIPEISDFENAELIIADSNSYDDTAILAKEILEKSDLEKTRWKIMNFNVPGKNIALNGVLETINSEIIVISDADANVKSGWLKVILSRFDDEEIGVISGIEEIKGAKNKKFNNFYRSNSNILRINESSIDSTPVLEGSLLAWKSSALTDLKLNENMNADDAQIGLFSIRNGYRSIIDPRITFDDFEGSERSFSESVRRSQGLSIALIKNSDLAIINKRKSAKSAIFNAIFLYVIFPWLALLYCINSAIAFTNNPIISSSWEFYSILSILMILFTNQGRSLIRGCLISIIAHIQIIIGKRYNNWEPSR